MTEQPNTPITEPPMVSPPQEPEPPAATSQPANPVTSAGSAGEGEAWIDRLGRALGTRAHCLIGLSMFRIVAGLAILIQYLLNYAQRRYLFGPDGVFPWQLFVDGVTTTRFSLYALSQSPVFFELVFHLGVVVAALWVMGWRTRWLTPINFVFWWSLERRFPGLWDGGDNIVRIVLVFAMFADVGAYFSLDRARRARRPAPPAGELRAAAMFHNVAVLAMAIQLCLLYGVAGLSKVQGETWRDGTALYYALRGGQYVWPGFSELVYENAYLVVVFGYVTVAFQVSFTFLFFMNRITRRVAIVLSLLFHLGIMSFMGLITFSMFMMSVDLALLGDDEYLALQRWWQRVGARRAATAHAT